MERERLLSALDAAEDYALSRGAKGLRDAREPGRRQKAKAEARLQAIVQRHFRRQAKRIAELMSLTPPAKVTKALGDLPPGFEDALMDDDFEAEMLRAMLDFTRDGVSMFGQTVGIGLDYTLVNTEAAKVARRYTLNLIKDITDTTRKAIQESVAAFVETPGMTIGDVMAQLPFDAVRAQRVAVTEITRAYSGAEVIAAKELQKEWPDVPVVITWHANNDDIQCPVCGELDGKERDVDGEFDDGIQQPPAHINCRCYLSTRTRING
jgi:hypothetical protein